MGAAFWLAGRWLPAGYASPGATDSLVDIFGQALTVGSLVKLVGTITSMSGSDSHFDDITFRPIFPQGGLASNSAPTTKIAMDTFSAHPLQLIKVGDHL